MTRALFLSLALVGCVTSGSGQLRRETLKFEGTAELPAGWKRMKTIDFELLTDLEAGEAQRAAQLLTQSLQGLAAMFGRAQPQTDRKLIVIALRDGLEFERRFGKFVWGFAATAGMETTVCLYGAPNRWFVRSVNFVDATHSVLQHELAHAVLARYFAQQPTWFAEGMAQYLETFRWLDSETVLLGEPNLQAWRSYSAVRSLSMKDAVEWSTYQQNELKIAGLYGLSWAFVHYAINREPQRFSALLEDLIEQHDGAFVKAFGPPSEELDRAIYAYLKQGKYAQLRLKVPLTSPVLVKLEPISAPTQRLDVLQKSMTRRAAGTSLECPP